MAQAAVMLRPRQQDPAAAPLATPGKPPLSPAMDTSLITSTVRKRKGGCDTLAPGRVLHGGGRWFGSCGAGDTAAQLPLQLPLMLLPPLLPGLAVLQPALCPCHTLQ